MPLREFVEHPIARELLHNNQMLQVGMLHGVRLCRQVQGEAARATAAPAWSQVLGVTNYSRWQDAASVRECFWQDEATRVSKP